MGTRRVGATWQKRIDRRYGENAHDQFNYNQETTIGKVLNDVRALLRYCAQLSDRKYLVEGWKEGLRYWRIDVLFD